MISDLSCLYFNTRLKHEMAEERSCSHNMAAFQFGTSTNNDSGLSDKQTDRKDGWTETVRHKVRKTVRETQGLQSDSHTDEQTVGQSERHKECQKDKGTESVRRS